MHSVTERIRADGMVFEGVGEKNIWLYGRVDLVSLGDLYALAWRQLKLKVSMLIRSCLTSFYLLCFTVRCVCVW